jgi:hypothetical protein
LHRSGDECSDEVVSVIPGRCESIEPGISRFPDVQAHI